MLDDSIYSIATYLLINIDGEDLNIKSVGRLLAKEGYDRVALNYKTDNMVGKTQEPENAKKDVVPGLLKLELSRQKHILICK